MPCRTERTPCTVRFHWEWCPIPIASSTWPSRGARCSSVCSTTPIGPLWLQLVMLLATFALATMYWPKRPVAKQTTISSLSRLCSGWDSLCWCHASHAPNALESNEVSSTRSRCWAMRSIVRCARWPMCPALSTAMPCWRNEWLALMVWRLARSAWSDCSFRMAIAYRTTVGWKWCWAGAKMASHGSSYVGWPMWLCWALDALLTVATGFRRFWCDLLCSRLQHLSSWPPSRRSLWHLAPCTSRRPAPPNRQTSPSFSRATCSPAANCHQPIVWSPRNSNRAAKYPSRPLAAAAAAARTLHSVGSIDRSIVAVKFARKSIHPPTVVWRLAPNSDRSYESPAPFAHPAAPNPSSCSSCRPNRPTDRPMPISIVSVNRRDRTPSSASLLPFSLLCRCLVSNAWKSFRGDLSAISRARLRKCLPSDSTGSIWCGRRWPRRQRMLWARPLSARSDALVDSSGRRAQRRAFRMVTRRDFSAVVDSNCWQRAISASNWRCFALWCVAASARIPRAIDALSVGASVAGAGQIARASGWFSAFPTILCSADRPVECRGRIGYSIALAVGRRNWVPAAFVAAAGSVGIDALAATDFALVFAVELFDLIRIATAGRSAIERFDFEAFWSIVAVAGIVRPTTTAPTTVPGMVGTVWTHDVRRPADWQRTAEKRLDCVRRVAAAGRQHAVALAATQSSARSLFGCDAARAIRLSVAHLPAAGTDWRAAVVTAARKIGSAAVGAIVKCRRATATIVRRQRFQSSGRTVCSLDWTIDFVAGRQIGADAAECRWECVSVGPASIGVLCRRLAGAATATAVEKKKI